jgi:hypothetical protein
MFWEDLWSNHIIADHFPETHRVSFARNPHLFLSARYNVVLVLRRLLAVDMDVV